MKLKIAVVQFDIKRLAPDDNLEKAEKFIDKAATSDADLIVFPEDFVTDPIVGIKEFADSAHKYRDHFQNLAKKYSIDLVPGSFIEEGNGKLYNTAYYIDSNGKVLSRYRKINLWHPERRCFTPGQETVAFDTRFGKVGLIICWDLIFPEVFREMARRGVEIVICPSYWCSGDAGKGIDYDTNSEIKLVNSLSVGRAFENEIIFVYCNAAGKLNLGKYSDTLIGHSQITAPFHGSIKRLEHNREEMFIQEVDTAILKVAEKAYKIRADLNK
ncbi:MAG: carbon-nitrogen hydrolase family protein [bacterium]|nr:carbon-nitrogen hydrolase family protein [bacterium]